MKKFIRIVLVGLVLTMFVSALFHITLLFVIAVLRGDLSVLNPISFLGISYIAPEMSYSRNALIISWASLIALYLIFVKVLASMDKIVALWYSSSTYTKLFEQTESLKKKLASLSLNHVQRFKIERFRSLNFLIRTNRVKTKSNSVRK